MASMTNASNRDIIMSTTTETWQHRDIFTNGIRMHYVIQGEGPLVVMLHGFPEFWYSWRHQIPFLAQHGYTAVAPDLRGYNDTDKPRRGYDIPTLLRDIEGLIKGLGHEKAVIVGHDWGGILAWAFAIRYPQMTERLIAMNAPIHRRCSENFGRSNNCVKAGISLSFKSPGCPKSSCCATRRMTLDACSMGVRRKKQHFHTR